MKRLLILALAVSALAACSPDPVPIAPQGEQIAQQAPSNGIDVQDMIIGGLAGAAISNMMTSRNNNQGSSYNAQRTVVIRQSSTRRTYSKRHGLPRG